MLVIYLEICFQNKFKRFFVGFKFFVKDSKLYNIVLTCIF